eukprot:TRINITY_DN7990_c0_g1_i2.p1 TRINITY_DN7990_c0_g1~~TRINITY_DN7990_c0_g1_i2.p1  ORF type:complete len:109 (+),score=9.13 TRINITY_DN7990_c0_g1_i2:64-390(+)
MSLLRTAIALRRSASNSVALAARSGVTMQNRNAMTWSMPRKGHNLEDHFDMAEFVCKMHSPTGEYLIWLLMASGFCFSFGPLLHSNYYFTGRFVPKDQGNTQLCDDSW